MGLRRRKLWQMGGPGRGVEAQLGTRLAAILRTTGQVEAEARDSRRPKTKNERRRGTTCPPEDGAFVQEQPRQHVGPGEMCVGDGEDTCVAVVGDLGLRRVPGDRDVLCQQALAECRRLTDPVDVGHILARRGPVALVHRGDLPTAFPQPCGHEAGTETPVEEEPRFVAGGRHAAVRAVTSSTSSP